MMHYTRTVNALMKALDIVTYGNRNGLANFTLPHILEFYALHHSGQDQAIHYPKKDCFKCNKGRHLKVDTTLFIRKSVFFIS